MFVVFDKMITYQILLLIRQSVSGLESNELIVKQLLTKYKWTLIVFLSSTQT